MPNWKKLLISGSDASLRSLNVATNVVAQSFTGSLSGTASFAITASHALTASYATNITISGSINNLDYIDFDTTASFTLAVGRLGWDNGEGTLQLGMSGGNVTYMVGEQLLQYVYNAETSSLSKGQVVLISGSQGNTISVRLANNSGDPSSAGTLGFVAETIGSGSNGWVLTEGPLRNINTSGLTAGSLLYLSSTPGAYTASIPQAPSHSVRLGYVERVHPTVGSIFVKIDNGYEIGELHDIVDNTTTASFGDLLIKSGSVWRNSRQLTGSYGLTGSLNATSFTGSLQGTASYASFALTASYVALPPLIVTGSTAQLNQTTPAVTWSFSHSLNYKYPAYEIYDSNDNVIIPSGIKAIDINTSEIYFAVATSGVAIANFSGISGSVQSSISASYAATSSYSNAFSIGQTITEYYLVTSSINGSNTVASKATGSYTSAFFKYTVASGSNARSGDIMSVWSGSTVQFTDNSTLDLGTTNVVTSSLSLSSGNILLNFQTNTAGWRIKSIVTFM